MSLVALLTYRNSNAIVHYMSSQISSAHSLMEKFKVSELGISEYEHWILAVRGKQVTIGSCVILLKRECARVSELFDAELIEFRSVSEEWETIVSKIFAPDKYNYIAAMMKDPFVHFHAIPRYRNPRTFMGVVFNDNSWPGMISFSQKKQTSNDLLLGVRDAFKNAK